MRIILLLTIVSCAVIMTNQINASTSLTVKAPVSTSTRRLYLDSRSPRDRRLEITMPKQMCAPAASAGAFLIEQTIDCAIKYLTAGAEKQAEVAGKAVKIHATAVKTGIAAGHYQNNKTGHMGTFNAHKHELAVFIMGKLLGSLGCPNKRRLGFFSNIGKSVKKAAKVVTKTVKKAAVVVKKAVVQVKKTANHIATEAKKTVNHVGTQINKAANSFGRTAIRTAANAKKELGNAGNAIKHEADKAAYFVKKEADKHAKIIVDASNQCLKTANDLVKDAKKVAEEAGKFA